jgi:16S rRNA (cytosine967-C5)-methyltransferase
MTPAAHIAAAIEILDLILAGENAETSLTKWGRSNRFAGSGDRNAIRDLVYDALRQKNSLTKRSKKISGRSWIIALFHKSKVNLDEYFGTGRYSPPKIKKWELDFLPIENESDVHDIPDWLWPKWKATLGRKANEVAYTLKERANIFLRVNITKCTRNDAIQALEKDGIFSKIHPTVSTALIVDKGTRNIKNSEAYNLGLVELQDASSQASILQLSTDQNGPILDYCAGGGGKALALNAYLNKPIFAYDANLMRMNNLPKRASRSGADIRIIKSNDLKISYYGLVFCDVPCSGSGTWRRDPEGKWSLTLKDYKRLLSLQENILTTAAPLVKANGRLVYATCSVLKDENKAQIQKFLANSNEWVFEQEKLFLPNELGDGFYYATLKKNKYSNKN